MGCSTSKLDDIPAVALCRHRSLLLSDAIRHHHSLFLAHSSYSRSLLSLSSALHRFLHSHLPTSSPSPSCDSQPISPFHSSASSSPPPHLAVHHARHRPQSPQTHYFQDPCFYPHPYAYPPYSYSNHFPQLSEFLPAPVVAERDSLGAPPPPMPSPPRASGWEFLNPFEGYGGFYGSYMAAGYTPSRSSREVREEEGIPELEEDDDLQEASKEAPFRDWKRAHLDSSTARRSSGEVSMESEEVEEEQDCEIREHEAHIVNENVRQNNGRQQQQGEGKRGVSAAVEEIMAQFDRASRSVEEVSWMLEVGDQKNVTFPAGYGNVDIAQFFEVREMGNKSLSSTLQRLYIWEKKLYEEVRAEEKMQALLERYNKRLKRLDQSGSEDQKVDSTQKMVRKLSTRIRIAIKVVQSISNKINKLRNEELWPQICDVIQGVMRMWAVMMECHQTQCQAILAAKSLDSIECGTKLSDAYMEVIKQLELEMLDWIGCFSTWINAQKSYVKALNGWLVKCIRHVPEKTSDGIAPFSPGRLGAPPVFVICNYWSQAIDRMSEREVVDAMQVFAADVLCLWERHSFEKRQKMMTDGSINEELKIMERDEREMRRAVEVKSRKVALVSGQNSHAIHRHAATHHHRGGERNLQTSLRRVFEAMENFTANSMRAYQELHVRSEELRLARGYAKVP